MFKKFCLGLTAISLVGLGGSTARAGHGCGPHWSIGIGIGVPVYRPYYYPYGYPYGYPYYYYPPPPPVVVQQPVIQQVPVPVQQVPAAAPAAAAPQQVQYQGVQPTSQVQLHSAPAANTDYYLQQLTNADERVRADSVMQLGRSKEQRVIDPLAATLSGDRSAVVRESAARALGLVGSPAALPALQHAAQTDSDRDVRRSAQFAVEVIQSR